MKEWTAVSPAVSVVVVVTVEVPVGKSPGYGTGGRQDCTVVVRNSRRPVGHRTTLIDISVENHVLRSAGESRSLCICHNNIKAGGAHSSSRICRCVGHHMVTDFKDGTIGEIGPPLPPGVVVIVGSAQVTVAPH